MSPRIIGIYGNGIGAGKSTVAKMLIENGFELVSFAAPMREMLTVLLQTLGHTETDARLMLSDQHKKKQDIVGLGRSPRHLLRTLGTEWGRSMVNTELWLMCWEATARRHLRMGRSIVCDDVRFANELHIIHDMPGSEVWCVEWEGAERSDHISDNNIPESYEPDRVIDNNEGLEELYAQVMRALG